MLLPSSFSEASEYRCEPGKSASVCAERLPGLGPGASSIVYVNTGYFLLPPCTYPAIPEEAPIVDCIPTAHPKSVLSTPLLGGFEGWAPE